MCIRIPNYDDVNYILPRDFYYSPVSSIYPYQIYFLSFFFFFHDCLIINFWLATLIERILQKHKIADFGRELWSPSRKGCPEPCPDGFWTSPRKRLHTLSVQPMPVLHHHSEKNYFLMFKKTLCSSLCSLPPVLAPLKRA